MASYLTKKENCRICQGKDLKEFLNLGAMPPANSFLKKEDLNKEEAVFPLRVYFCHDCGLVQLLDVVAPKLLFKDYSYLTSASSPLVDHFAEMAKELADRLLVSKKDLFVEIGGNDGSLLKVIKDRCRVLNIEPAKNVAQISREQSVEAIDEFFSKKLADKILKNYGQAKVVVANNVVAHIDDLQEFFEGVKILVGKNGVFVFEVHWVGNLIGGGGFDQVYHEHLSYFSLMALQKLVKLRGFKIFDVALVSVHGQSLRVYVGDNKKIEKSVDDFLNKEQELGLNQSKTYSRFAKKVQRNKTKLMNLLLKLKKQGKRIAGYGAPAKGNTLLNYCGIDKQILDYIIDTTPFKQEKLTPGTYIPIYSADKLFQKTPDYILLLSWNYADAIIKKEQNLRDRGVKFIIPVPEVRVV